LTGLELAPLTALAAAALAVFFSAGWLLSLARHDVSTVDVQWGLAFVLVAAIGAFLGGGAAPRRVLLLLLVGIWGARLAWHIHRRNRGKGEDYRYAAMRERHGSRFPWVSLFTVFLLQGALALFIALPLLAAAAAPEPPALGVWDLAGLLLWTVGFLFEAVGDAQLARFKADPAHRGRVMDRGLWRYTRHPNYFGDATLWWGLFLVACATPGGWKTVASPLVMTFLLLKVSGVALLEKGLARTKPGYADYVARTSAFLPWFPRTQRGA
jgi:steroid 5-alpha reductase family enzyme